MCILKTATRIECGVTINASVTVLQLTMDAAKSEPNSDNEMYSDSIDELVDVKEEEVPPPVMFLQVKTKKEVSFASCYFLRI